MKSLPCGKHAWRAGLEEAMSHSLGLSVYDRMNWGLYPRDNWPLFFKHGARSGDWPQVPQSRHRAVNNGFLKAHPLLKDANIVYGLKAAAVFMKAAVLESCTVLFL